MGVGVEKFFAGTGLIDVVLAATLLEWIALEIWWRRMGSGVHPVDVRLVFLAGLALMLAVRTVLMALPWFVTAMLLSAAGLVHLADLRRRWSASSI
jgi:hypothetical protein